MNTIKIQPVNPECLLCGKAEFKHYLDKRSSAYYQCKICKGIFVWPVQKQKYYLESDTYLKDMKLYLNRTDLEGQRWMVDQFERMYKLVMQREGIGSFFEIGAGAGFMTLFAYAKGWDASGIETSKVAVKFAKQNLKIKLELSTIELYKTKKTYDAFAMVEVLEHFRDPLKAIECIRKISKRWSFIFGTTPNTDSKHWQKSDQDIYQPEDHIFLFNEAALKLFANKAGIGSFIIEKFGAGRKHDSNLMYAGIIENPNL